MTRNGKGGVGQTLIRQQRQNRLSHPSSSSRNGPLESITDVRDLDDLMEKAELAGRIYSSDNPLPELLIEEESAESLTPEERRRQQVAEEELFQSSLRVPRRPSWHHGMTPEELDIKERKSFLEWRRSLVRLEENEKLVITPFEKNIDIWRQLWRVLERSDLVVMVVDARNPLFYRCPDLEAYVREIDEHKRTILLLNKSDLLPVSARVKWAEYLKAEGIPFVFWSAKNASLTEEEREAANISSNEDGEVEILGKEDLLSYLLSEAEQVSERRKASRTESSSDHEAIEPGMVSHIPTGARLNHNVVGFVGYPNVGKSSTINALLGEKRTGVTSTPGKTKHFQTFLISDKLMICDCPGLVFPSFSSSRSDMVASGVLPIDKMIDHRGPIQAVANLVPRVTFESVYGLSLPKPKAYEPIDRPPTSSEVLKAYAVPRGYFAAGGLPDETRAARYILKDYLSGKLLYYHLPPLSETESDDVVSHKEMECVSDASESSLREDSNKPSEAAAQSFLEDLASFDRVTESKTRMAGKSAGGTERRNALSHKMHKKAPRRKDRSWRAGKKDDDDSEGMVLVRGVQKPVSHGVVNMSLSSN